MHSRPTSGQWVRAEQYIQGYDKLISNIFWFLADSVSWVPGYDFQADAALISSTLAAQVKPILAVSNTIIGTYVLFGQPGGSLGLDIYESIPGTGPSGSSFPEDVAVVVQKLTNSMGPSNRGRWFFSGCPQIFGTGNYLTSGGLTAMATMTTAFAAPITAGGGGDYYHANFSPKLGTLAQITSFSHAGLLATARRRRPRF